MSAGWGGGAYAEDDGEISDGYHTFNELYEHRHRLFIALCRQLDLRAAAESMPSSVWRSRKHADGSMYDGWFIMGIHEKPGEQVSYHLPERLWDATVFARELPAAPVFDGHSPADVIDRLVRL